MPRKEIPHFSQTGKKGVKEEGPMNVKREVGRLGVRAHPMILATQEAQIRKTEDQGQPGQKVH
jgi:hypothetical protein